MTAIRWTSTSSSWRIRPASTGIRRRRCGVSYPPCTASCESRAPHPCGPWVPDRVVAAACEEQATEILSEARAAADELKAAANADAAELRAAAEYEAAELRASAERDTGDLRLGRAGADAVKATARREAYELTTITERAARGCNGRSLDANGERTVAHRLD
jgi:hypothetical protein